MGIESFMESYGFGASSSGGGCEWYTKRFIYNEQNAFYAITDDGGLGLPESLNEAVYVGIYDEDSGEEIVEAKRYVTLQSFLDSI